MSMRSLLEAFKYLTVPETYCSVALVSSAWKSIAYKDELILHFLSSEGFPCESDFPLSTQLQQQWGLSHISFLVHLDCGKAKILTISSRESTLASVASPLFANSSRYTMESSTTAVITGGRKSLRSAVRLHLLSGTLTQLPDLLTDRAGHGIASVNGSVVIGGGNVSTGYLQSSERLSDSQWTCLGDMSVARYNLTFCVYRMKVTALGGYNRSGFQTIIERLDREMWVRTDMTLPDGRNYPSAIQSGADMVVIGGYNQSAHDWRVLVWKDDLRKWKQVDVSYGDYTLSNAVILKNGEVHLANKAGKHEVLSGKLD